MMPRLLGVIALVYPDVVAQWFPTLHDPMDCSPLGSSVHGIFLARVLDWVAISYSRRSSQPRDRTCVSYVSCTGMQLLTTVPSGSPVKILGWPKISIRSNKILQESSNELFGQPNTMLCTKALKHTHTHTHSES